MKELITFLFLISFSNSFGQFAVVNDKTGLLNIRKEASENNKIVDKIENGHLIYCFENKKSFTDIYYSKNGKELNGYACKNGYKLVSGFTAFITIKKTDTSITLKNDTIKVIITKSEFDKKTHKLKFRKEYPNLIELIDNKKFWGRDEEMPTTQFEKIIVQLGSKIILLPQTATEGLYQPSIYSTEVNYDIANEIIYIQTKNGDGAGAYYVIWKIEKGIYKDRLVVHGF